MRVVFHRELSGDARKRLLVDLLPDKNSVNDKTPRVWSSIFEAKNISAL